MPRGKRHALTARMRGDLTAALDRDPAARNKWEVALLYPGVHAVWAHRVSHWLWQRDARFLARGLSEAARWATGVEIHPGAQIGDNMFIDHGSGIVIGETTVIGDDVTIYHGVTLGGTGLEHGKRHPSLGDRVVLGAGSKVLGNITVGDDSRIGANAVLVRSVESRSVVVGVPGQVISSSSSAKRETKPPKFDDEPPRSDPIASTLQALLRRVDQLEKQLHVSSEQADLQMHSVGVWETPDFSI